MLTISDKRLIETDLLDQLAVWIFFFSLYIWSMFGLISCSKKETNKFVWF